MLLTVVTLVMSDFNSWRQPLSMGAKIVFFDLALPHHDFIIGWRNSD
jgi:hypothetical protein